MQKFDYDYANRIFFKKPDIIPMTFSPEFAKLKFQLSFLKVAVKILI